jgi:hypothetical protein
MRVQGLPRRVLLALILLRTPNAGKVKGTISDSLHTFGN